MEPKKKKKKVFELGVGRGSMPQVPCLVHTVVPECCLSSCLPKYLLQFW